MASLAAHLINPVLRVQVKRKLARATDAESLRKAFRSPMPTPRGVRYTPSIIGGVPGEWVEPAFGAPPAMTVLYLHGGGYVVCSAESHRPVTGGLARRGLRVFAADYRLAPAHPFPAAVDDGFAAFRGLVAQGHDPASLAIAGDSAGGGLALAVALRVREAGMAMPARLVLFSPWTDLAGTGRSAVENRRCDPMIQGGRIAEGARPYLAGTDPYNPFASPLYADLAGLPPILVHVGAREVLLDDSVRLHEKALAAGVDSLLRIWPVVPHAWPIFQAILPEGRAALDESAAFIRGAAPPPAALR
ncbi:MULTISPECIES: alpha/beta hydrolase [Acidiphilium]|jgi:acetyl esterase/lipase|uniref:alpha/beta hydrolase n=1 Tax=Acidiphilium TaxID=522 RepID=UPI001B8B4D93|nr:MULTISPECIES: alpha/beta hydrolase [Acidiphilium]MBS3024349.1 alpha/beta hydrolase [Acidiphilium multivorum]